MKILEVKIDDNKNVLVDSDFKKVDSDMIFQALLSFMQKTGEDIYRMDRQEFWGIYTSVKLLYAALNAVQNNNEIDTSLAEVTKYYKKQLIKKGWNVQIKDNV